MTEEIRRTYHRVVSVCCGFAAALFLVACSTIADNERLIYVKPADVARKVLIEDFTGQRCINCPRATLVIGKLQEEYGHDAVIAVGIHSGPLGFKGTPTLTGLATELGDEYYSHWGIEYQPQGLVNRTGRCDYQLWATEVDKLITQQSSLQISMDCHYNEATREVVVDLTTLGTNGATDGRLQLWVTEDSITAMQLRYNEIDNPASGQLSDGQYVHNHVLRHAVNGTWGDDFHCTEGEQQQLHYTFIADASWRPEQLSLVAFVYNDEGVVQVEQKKIIQ